MSEKGGISIPIFHCTFNGDGSITHFAHEFDSNLYSILPNLYSASIIEKSSGLNKVFGAVMVKTSLSHDDREFRDALETFVRDTAAFEYYFDKDFSLIPIKLGLPAGDQDPLTEDEFLRIATSGYFKHSQSGTA